MSQRGRPALGQERGRGKVGKMGERKANCVERGEREMGLWRG